MPPEAPAYQESQASAIVYIETGILLLRLTSFSGCQEPKIRRIPTSTSPSALASVSRLRFAVVALTNEGPTLFYRCPLSLAAESTTTTKRGRQGERRERQELLPSPKLVTRSGGFNEDLGSVFLFFLGCSCNQVLLCMQMQCRRRNAGRDDQESGRRSLPPSDDHSSLREHRSCCRANHDKARGAGILFSFTDSLAATACHVRRELIKIT